MNNFLHLCIFIHFSIFNQSFRALWRVFLIIPWFFVVFIAAPSLRPRTHPSAQTPAWYCLPLFLYLYNKKRAFNAVWRSAFKTHQNRKKQPFPTALRSHVTQNARIVVFIYLFYIYLFEFRWYHGFPVLSRVIPFFPIYTPLWHGMCSSTRFPAQVLSTAPWLLPRSVVQSSQT